jgi:hypothetical protein
VHAPVLSQAVAPQVASIVLHLAVQQLPVPLTPQMFEVQSSFSVQAPVPRNVVHVALLQTKPVAQSKLDWHVVRQDPPLEQARWLGQAAGVPAVHDPAPLQALVVSVLLEHEASQVVVLAG